MASDGAIPAALRKTASPEQRTGEDAAPQRAGGALHGLLITADSKLTRIFGRELSRCAESTILFEVRASYQEALNDAASWYRWVAVDLDCAIAPSEAVRLVRRSWPRARVAVLSFWWSERDAIARNQADIVIHKPLRSPELRAFLRAVTSAPQSPANPTQEHTVSTSTG